jgi:shikimate dehydrogenase
MGKAIEITGRTRFTAILGDPIEHSLSPVMHNAAYEALGIERAYLAFHVAAQDLPLVLRAIRALKIAGVNLTVPHKEAAVAMMSHLSEEAGLLGAVNCVINRDGELHGDNTDARGLERDLRQSGVTIEGRPAIIIGAGGAAASALLVCRRMGAARIVLCNRTVERAIKLAERFARHQGWSDVPIRAGGLELLTQPEVIGGAALVINATSMGLAGGGFAPVAYAATPHDCVFYDMLYARDITPFLTPARALGRQTLDGAGMLLHQGVLAFELFNGLVAPVEVMRTALLAALGRS